MRSRKLIRINKPIFGEEETQALLEVVSSGSLTDSSLAGGERVRRFEKAFREFLGAKDAVAVNSGTSALYASLLSLGLQEGDEVLLPSFTFIPTWAAVLQAGARPVLVDIEDHDYTIDPQDLERKITRNSRVVIPVHMYGYPSKMEEIQEVAERHQLYVLEDASQSLGATYDGTQTGSLGTLAVFSLSGGKVITTGEGGMVTSTSSELAEEVRRVRNHGFNDISEAVTRGTNLRMPEMEAAVGHVQLRHLRTRLSTRRRNAEELSKLLEGVKGIRTPTEDGRRKGNWYLYTVTIEGDRDLVLRSLQESNIDARVFYKIPVHRQPVYTKMGYEETLPKSDWAASHVLSLPIHPSVGKDELLHVGKSLRSALEE